MKLNSHEVPRWT